MSHNHSHHTDVTKTFVVTKGPKSTATITGEVPFEILEEERKGALAALGQDLELKGFRKGHVPDSMIEKHFGEMAVLTEMAERVLHHFYGHILHEHKLDAISRPTINITKLAPGNPFGFTIELQVLPEVILPDYKKIAAGKNKEKEDAALTDKEIEEAIERIQRQKLSYERIQEKAKKRAAAEEAQKNGVTLPTPETVGEADPEEDITKLPLPALTDEYVKTLGAFDSVDAFKKQVAEHLEREKKEEAMSKQRAGITDALIEGSTIDLADILVETEIAQMFGQMEEELSRAGLTISGYLDHVKKTREDMIKEWTPTAEKRAKTQLILNEIAKKESLAPKSEDIEREAAPLLAQYKNADPTRVRIYVASMLQNNAVMEFLEKQ